MTKTHYIQQPDSGKTSNLIKEIKVNDLVMIPYGNQLRDVKDLIQRNKNFKLLHEVIHFSYMDKLDNYRGKDFSKVERVLVDDFLTLNEQQLAFFWKFIEYANIQEVIAWSTPVKVFSKEVFVASKTVKYWNEEELKKWITPFKLDELKAKCKELTDYMLMDAKVEKVFKIMSGEEQQKMHDSLGKEKYDLMYRLRMFE